MSVYYNVSRMGTGKKNSSLPIFPQQGKNVTKKKEIFVNAEMYSRVQLNIPMNNFLFLSSSKNSIYLVKLKLSNERE